MPKSFMKYLFRLNSFSNFHAELSFFLYSTYEVAHIPLCYCLIYQIVSFSAYNIHLYFTFTDKIQFLCEKKTTRDTERENKQKQRDKNNNDKQILAATR